MDEHVLTTKFQLATLPVLAFSESLAAVHAVGLRRRNVDATLPPWLCQNCGHELSIPRTHGKGERKYLIRSCSTCTNITKLRVTLDAKEIFPSVRNRNRGRSKPSSSIIQTTKIIPIEKQAIKDHEPIVIPHSVQKSVPQVAKDPRQSMPNKKTSSLQKMLAAHRQKNIPSKGTPSTGLDGFLSQL